VKIDVEGYEQEVLKGLSVPVGALSFEFHRHLLTEAMACVRLLPNYRFNYCLDECPQLQPDW
jgi:hypothetical protein